MDAPATAQSPIRRRTLPAATPRMPGWIGAWLAVVVLAAWHCSFGLRHVVSDVVPPAQAAWVACGWGRTLPFLLCIAALFAAASASRARRAHGRSGWTDASAILTWAVLAAWAGWRGAEPSLDRPVAWPAPVGAPTEWVVRIDSIDWTRTPPLWSGRAFAWVAGGSWVMPGRGLPVRGSWTEAETGGLLLRGAAAAPAAGECLWLRVEAAFRLTGAPGSGRRGAGATCARWRTAISDSAMRALGSDAGSLAVRTLLGPAPPLAPGWEQPFRETGTMHLLSISGFHLTLIGGILWTLLRVACRGARWSRWPALAVLGAYAYLVGGPAPVQRAFGAALLLAFGPDWGRARRFWNAFGWMAALLPVLAPAVPATASFRLSFSAMAGVIWGGQIATVRRPRRNARRRRCVLQPVLQLLCASVGASLLTAPWSLHHFGIVYPLGIAANLLAIPAMAVTLAVQGLAVVAVALGAGEAFPLVAAGRAAGESFLAGLRLLADVSGRWACVGGLDVPAALAWTFTLGVTLRVLAHGRPRAGSRAGRWLLVGALPALAAGVTDRARELPLARAPLEVDFLDVGQGDAILLRLGARRWLVDLGVGSRTGRRERLVGALCARGVRRLDRVWITHGDGDHWGGLADLLESPVRVDTLVLPAGAPFPRAFWTTLADGPRRPVVVRAAQSWSRALAEGVRIRVLHPPGVDATDGDPLPRSTNEWSLALLFETPDARRRWRPRALLSGDLERDREEMLVRAWGEGPPATVAQLAHHGSRTAGTEAWWARARPGLAVISVGRNNAYGLPHVETLEAIVRHGARLRRTDENGAIRCVFDREGVRVRAERPPVGAEQPDAEHPLVGAKRLPCPPRPPVL